MADDHTQRSFRSNAMASREAPGTGASNNDPLAELARLIGQNDPFAEYGREPAPPAPPQQPSRVNPDWAAHVAADAGYIAPPAAPPPHHADFAPPPDLHPAEIAPPAYKAGVPGYEGGEAGYDHEAYYQNPPPSETEHHDFYDDVPPRRRMGILIGAAVFALAVIGTAGAFGYHAIFGTSGGSGAPPVIKADTSPSKILPAKKSADAKNGKLIYDRVAGHDQGAKLVSREEQPVDIEHKSAGVIVPHDQMPSGTIQSALGSGVVGGAPRKVHTIAIRPDGRAMADAAPNAPPVLPPSPSPSSAQPTDHPAPPAAAVNPAPTPHAGPAKPPPRRSVARAELPTRHQTEASSNGPLSLSPNASMPAVPERHAARAAPAAPTPQARRTEARAAPASAGHGGYAVQVASRHNEAAAQASLHSLQAKFARQLAGHKTLVRRVDLGAKGVYYRAMVGPFGSAEEASHMCSQLKAAGGSCFVQRI